MPEMTFDENGWPIWTNAQDGTGTDPEPLSAAIAAVSSIGQPGGIPLPGSIPEMGPGAVPTGAPPAETRENALINPANDALEYPSPDAVVLPAPGSANPQYQNLDAITGTQQSLVSPPPQPAVMAGQDPATAAVPITAPVARGGKPAKASKIDPVAAANAAVDQTQLQAAQAGMDYGVAVNEAARQLAERRAVSQEEYAAKQAKADGDFQAARDLAQQQSEAETAKWMAEMEMKAKEEPNPKRWFAKQSTFGKAMWLMSLAFGTKAAASAPGVQNIGLAMIKSEIDNDMAEQKARLAREMEVLRNKGQIIDKKTAQRLAFLKDDHSIRAGQLLALEKAALERANAPGSADDRAAMAQAHQWLATQRMTTAAARAQQAFQARESQLSRAHSAYMQKNQQEFTAQQNAIARAEAAAKDALDRAWKLQEEQAKAAAKAKGDKASSFSIDPKASGVNLVVGGKAQPLTINVGDEAGKKRAEQVTNLANAAQEVSAELRIIQDAVKDGTFMERLLGSDANLQAAVTRLGYSKAKENDPRGIVTNADFTAGLVSAMGARYDSVSGRFLYDAKQALNGKDASKELVTAIDKELAVVESRTSAKLNTYVPLEERGGGDIKWRAANRNPVSGETESLDQMLQRVSPEDQDGWIPRGIDQPQTMEDLKKGQQAAKAGAKDALPHYQRLPDDPVYESTQQVVDEARKHFNGEAGYSPEVISRMSEGFQKSVGTDQRARLEVLEAAEVATKVAEKREEEAKRILLKQKNQRGKITVEDTATALKRAGLGPMVAKAEYLDEMMAAVDAMQRNPSADAVGKLKPLTPTRVKMKADQ